MHLHLGARGGLARVAAASALAIALTPALGTALASDPAPAGPVPDLVRPGLDLVRADPDFVRARPGWAAPSAAAAVEARERSRICLSPGCSGADPQPWTRAAGFGAAVLAAGWIGRRRQATGG